MFCFVLITSLFACSGPSNLHDASALRQASTDGSAPEVAFQLGERLTQGDRVYASVSDAEQAAQTLEVSLESSIDGPLWSGNPAADGGLELNVSLSVGEHLLTLWAYDAAGNEGRDGVQVQVVAKNQAPSCAVISPANHAVFLANEPVPFVGVASDPDGDPVRLSWSSDLYGAIFMGERYSPVLPNGLHHISVRGSDGVGGECHVNFDISIGL